MPFTCPQCGATYATDERCEDRFNVSQIQELEDPAYYAVHQFSVACYMLQHNAYSRDGWLATRDLLAQFHAGLTPDEVRRRHRRDVDSGRRTWSITKGPKLAGVETISWSRTIADVRLDTAAHYCADVRAWAETILADSAVLTGSLKGPL